MDMNDQQRSEFSALNRLGDRISALEERDHGRRRLGRPLWISGFLAIGLVGFTLSPAGAEVRDSLGTPADATTAAMCLPAGGGGDVVAGVPALPLDGADAPESVEPADDVGPQPDVMAVAPTVPADEIGCDDDEAVLVVDGAFSGDGPAPLRQVVAMTSAQPPHGVPPDEPAPVAGLPADRPLPGDAPEHVELPKPAPDVPAAPDAPASVAAP